MTCAHSWSERIFLPHWTRKLRCGGLTGWDSPPSWHLPALILIFRWLITRATFLQALSKQYGHIPTDVRKDFVTDQQTDTMKKKERRREGAAQLAKLHSAFLTESSVIESVTSSISKPVRKNGHTSLMITKRHAVRSPQTDGHQEGGYEAKHLQRDTWEEQVTDDVISCFLCVMTERQQSGITRS